MAHEVEEWRFLLVVWAERDVNVYFYRASGGLRAP
jgi:hypothetical protein